MKTNREQRFTEAGNALIYVLIAIALFAALSFVLARQTDTSESAGVSGDKANLYATQLISYATQTKQVMDQLVFSGTDINNLDFMLPSDPAFNTGTTGDHVNMVYHPDGGGLIPATLPPEVIKQTDADPVAGWYLGRFNNIDWTKTGGQDVILVAYQIDQSVCQKINDKLGVSTIPSISDDLKSILIDAESYATGANQDLTTGTTDICPECENKGSLCIQEGGQYAFYSVVADQ